MKQFKVNFTNETINGTKKFSSTWFNSIEEALKSRWMNEPNSTIEERKKPEHGTFAEFKARKTK